MGIISTEWTVPLNRVFLLNPGQALDVGDRRLHCYRPPLFDSPSTTGFLDDRTGVLFSSDCFGAPIPSEELATSTDIHAVGDQVRNGRQVGAEDRPLPGTSAYRQSTGLLAPCTELSR